MKTNYILLIAPRSIPLRIRNISHRSCRENQHTHYNVKKTGWGDVEGMDMAQIGMSGGLSWKF